MGKKTKQRVELVPIVDAKKRRKCFSSRKESMVTKAHELQALTGCEIVMLIAKEDMKTVYQYTSNNLREEMRDLKNLVTSAAFFAFDGSTKRTEFEEEIGEKEDCASTVDRIVKEHKTPIKTQRLIKPNLQIGSDISSDEESTYTDDEQGGSLKNCNRLDYEGKMQRGLGFDIDLGYPVAMDKVVTSASPKRELIEINEFEDDLEGELIGDEVSVDHEYFPVFSSPQRKRMKLSSSKKEKYSPVRRNLFQELDSVDKNQYVKTKPIDEDFELFFPEEHEVEDEEDVDYTRVIPGVPVDAPRRISIQSPGLSKRNSILSECGFSSFDEMGDFDVGVELGLGKSSFDERGLLIENGKFELPFGDFSWEEGMEYFM